MLHTNRYVEVDASEFSKTDIAIHRGRAIRYYRTNVRRQRALWKLTDNLLGSPLRVPGKCQRPNVVKQSLNLMFDVAESIKTHGF